MEWTDHYMRAGQCVPQAEELLHELDEQLTLYGHAVLHRHCSDDVGPLAHALAALQTEVTDLVRNLMDVHDVRSALQRPLTRAALLQSVIDYKNMTRVSSEEISYPPIVDRVGQAISQLYERGILRRI
ncbi:MAG: hypothetical protein PHW10_05510 [Candidatus Peribacteraceae bacterium]|nr:hypothetical protein [Candidatus Peribacteraceae bacterium]